MSSAASAATPAEQPRRRRARPGISHRSALYLLVGLLLAAGIPVVATIALNRQLGARLLRASPHAHSDRLVVVRGGVVLGTAKRIEVEGRTVTVGGTRYRGFLTPVPNAGHAKLLALRPQSAIADA